MSDDKPNINAALRMIIDGHSQGDIVELLNAEGVQQAAEIIESAFDELEKAADVSPDVRRGWCLEALRDLYRRMLASGDYDGARKAVNEIAKIAGVGAARRAVPAKPAKQKPVKGKAEVVAFLRSKI